MITPHVHIPFSKIKDYLLFIRDYRLNLEIYFNSKTLDTISSSDIEELKGSLYLPDYNPQFTVHAPFMDLSPGAIDTMIRDVTIKRFTQTLKLVEPLTPPAVIFHSGYEKWKYSDKTDIWLEGSLRTWKEIIGIAQRMKTKIAIENIFEHEPLNLRFLMEELSSQWFGICLDTGHLNLFSKRPLSAWIKELLPYVIEFHLHDNDKTSDSHLSIGDGTFNFDELFSAIKGSWENYIFTIESHTPESVMKSIKRFNEYYQRVLT